MYGVDGVTDVMDVVSDVEGVDGVEENGGNSVTIIDKYWVDVLSTFFTYQYS